MKVVRLDKNEWAALSEKAHLIVFNKHKPLEWDRSDFTLVVESKTGAMMLYTTCRELDAESLYWQYGGAFPGTRGTVLSFVGTQAILRWCKEFGYKRVSFYVENTNAPMLKLAMRCGFKIIGVRNYNGNVLVEHLKEFEQ